ncbi:hypothetical protein ACFELO_08045 [Oceanicaulis sp. LC35]|uniref:hypothetical protein n=1 Tax=Oceanicaulis sp. LC35 TaxID=3349635 RepID=UPI003F85E92A
MSLRDLYQVTVVARPLPHEEAVKRGKLRATLLVSGNLDSVVQAANAWVMAQDLTLDRHEELKLLRKSKSREGPGLVEVLSEDWMPL